MSAAAAMKVVVRNAGTASANGVYLKQAATTIPSGFAKVCIASRWNTEQMWDQLTDGVRPWYLKADDAYIYYNRGDGKWWIDAPEGHGLYVAFADSEAPDAPPANEWKELQSDYLPLPVVRTETD